MWFDSTLASMWNLKLSSFIFIPALITGVFIIFSAHDWISIWIGIEINIYAFIPIIYSSSSSKTQEATTKYFLIQAFGSGIFLLGTFGRFFSRHYTIIIFMALILKAGIAPLHFWYPRVINTLSWWPCLILTTLQKLGPLFLIIQALRDHTSTIRIIRATSAAIGAIGGLNQTQLRAILAYSSIGHIGWILAATQLSNLIAKIYFSLYITTVSSIILIIIKSQIISNNQSISQVDQSPFSKPSLIALLLSLGGVPPMLGFFPKLIVIITLCSQNYVKLPIILIISSMLNIYYYLKIFYSSFFSINTKSLVSPTWYAPPYISLPIFSLITTASIFGFILTLPLLIS